MESMAEKGVVEEEAGEGETTLAQDVRYWWPRPSVVVVADSEAKRGGGGHGQGGDDLVVPWPSVVVVSL